MWDENKTFCMIICTVLVTTLCWHTVNLYFKHDSWEYFTGKMIKEKKCSAKESQNG